MSLNNSLCKSERVIFSVRQLQGGLDFLCEGVTEHIGGACLKYLFLTRSHLGITGFWSVAALTRSGTLPSRALVEGEEWRTARKEGARPGVPSSG